MENNLNSTNNDKETTALNVILLFLLVPIVTFLILINTAYPAMMTWNLWIPEISGLPELTLPYAVMAVLTIRVFKGGRLSKVEDNRTKKIKNNDLIMVTIAPWIVYVIAYVTYKFFIV